MKERAGGHLFAGEIFFEVGKQWKGSPSPRDVLEDST